MWQCASLIPALGKLRWGSVKPEMHRYARPAWSSQPGTLSKSRHGNEKERHRDGGREERREENEKASHIQSTLTEDLDAENTQNSQSSLIKIKI